MLLLLCLCRRCRRCYCCRLAVVRSAISPKCFSSSPIVIYAIIIVIVFLPVCMRRKKSQQHSVYKYMHKANKQSYHRHSHRKYVRYNDSDKRIQQWARVSEWARFPATIHFKKQATGKVAYTKKAKKKCFFSSSTNKDVTKALVAFFMLCFDSLFHRRDNLCCYCQEPHIQQRRRRRHRCACRCAVAVE